MRQAIALLMAFSLTFPAFADNPAVTVSVDANANRHPINPNIYGVAYGTAATLADLNAPLNRYGGNNTSRYNWQVNGDNRGQDWDSVSDRACTLRLIHFRAGRPDGSQRDHVVGDPEPRHLPLSHPRVQ